ncbi:hypothetical protein [Luteibacter sp. 9135]|uniref:hypothetical protein n=1 Tax=Luteibacter sp. 9135 TaxID=1500893 RepID=UPI00055C9B41|nr:hypothetical protein [Luteibacter sp. 9135]
MHRFLVLSLVGGGIALHGGPGHATPMVTVDAMGLDQGNVTAQLERTSQYFVNAMRRLLTEGYPDSYRAIRWENLEEAMNRARVARFEYRYTVHGTEYVRVYHALDGKPLSMVAEEVFSGPTPRGSPTPPRSPASPDGLIESDAETASGIGTVSEHRDMVATDMGDDSLFVEFDSLNVRARILPADSSVLEGYDVPSMQGELDAEFKALRAIEYDIHAQVIPRGGRIRGAVGGATCSSCRDAMRDFARAYDADVQVTQMYGSIARSEQQALIASGRARMRGQMLVDASSGEPLLARDILGGARAAQVRRELSAGSLGRAFKGMSWRQRSFRLGTPRLPRVSEGSGTDDPAGTAVPPEC